MTKMATTFNMGIHQILISWEILQRDSNTPPIQTLNEFPMMQKIWRIHDDAMWNDKRWTNYRPCAMGSTAISRGRLPPRSCGLLHRLVSCNVSLPSDLSLCYCHWRNQLLILLLLAVWIGRTWQHFCKVTSTLPSCGRCHTAHWPSSYRKGL